MRVRLFFFLSFLSLVFPIRSTAQQVSDGNQNLPPFGGFSGSDFDTVSLQNGNVHIHIPILSVKQRHGTVARAFVYDTPSFTLTKTVTVVLGHRYTQYTVDRNFLLFGWHLANEGDSGSWGINPTNIQENCGSGTVGALGFYTVIGPEGVKHPLHLHTGGCLGAITTSPTFDGTGIMVDIGQTPNLITLKDGTQIHVGTQREDANGNIMTGATDDLGRTLFTVTNGPTTTYTSPLGKTASEPAYTNWTVTDSNGNSQTYRLDYTLLDTQTSFCGSPAASPCTNDTGGAFFPAKLTLPNAKFYQFNWVNASAAELQSIVLPTGASISYTYANLCVGSLSTGSQDCRRGVQSRTVTQNGVSSTWNYSIFPGYYATETDPLGNDTVHTFGPVVATDGFSGSLSTVETQLSQYSGSASSGLLLRKTVKDYTGEDANPTVENVRLIRETTTLDNGSVAKTETDYELISNSQFSTFTRLNPTEKREYD